MPAYTPPYEAAQRDTDLARRYPLALIAPASHYFLNAMFVTVPELAQRQGGLTIELHPGDAQSRGLLAQARGGSRQRQHESPSATPTWAAARVFHDNRVEVTRMW